MTDAALSPHGSVTRGRCVCSRNCWQARCFKCNRIVTKHDFSKEDAAAILADHVKRGHP